MEHYYINFSFASNNWLVKNQSENPEEAGKIIQIFQTKKAAEDYISKLNEKEYGTKKNV